MTDFADWYALYPKKVARRDAEKAWAKLTLPQRQMAVDALPAHVHRWRMTATGWDFMPHAATWLNGQRFLDELPNNGGGIGKSPQVDPRLTTQAQAGVAYASVAVAPTLNGAAAANPIPASDTSLSLAAAVAPPVTRLATGPVELGAIFAGLKLQLKRSKG